MSDPDCPSTLIRDREAVLLAPYAMHSCDSAGRRHTEPSHPYRGPYQRDRDRIIHSGAYRRLSHKTQVFTGEMGDYHRTRLTHTLEVASIARTLGRALRLNEDLVEALALVHDLGHPPFGHAGEDVLDACLAEAPADGSHADGSHAEGSHAEGGRFNHNAQCLRIVERLEVRYRAFPGLNLSLEVLEGQAARADKNRRQPASLLEVQVVDAADSVAYDTHDADDALELELLTIDELLEQPLWHEAAERIARREGPLDGEMLRRAIVHELIDWQVSDLLAATRARLQQIDTAKLGSREAVNLVRGRGTIVGPSPELAEKKQALEAFLYDRVYRDPRVMQRRRPAQDALRAMFEGYLARPELLPPKFRDAADEQGLPRSVADYLAGMTDRFAEQEHARLFA